MNISHYQAETKVGIFTLVTLIIIAVITFKVSDHKLFGSGVYQIEMVMQNANGINDKTPVEIAGIQIGHVRDVRLENSRLARVTLELEDDVMLTAGSTAVLRSKGFLGDTYIEIMPGASDQAVVQPGEQIQFQGTGGDINSLIAAFSDIAGDVKVVTSTLKEFVNSDESSPFYRIMHNMDQFSATLSRIVVQNERNVDSIAANLAEFSKNIRQIIDSKRGDIEQSIDHLENITRKVDAGEGTIGKLINDPETVKKLNGAIDNLNNLLGGLNKLETQIGYHTEYLGVSKDFKHYVELGLQPRPDERFLLEFINDPDPSPTRVEQTTDITAGGATSQVLTKTSTINRNQFRISAQLAKDFYDFTLRGGIIESSGGVGIDYQPGPIGVGVSAFDLSSYGDKKPHIKVTGNVKMTKNLFLLGGADDMLNPTQKTDWFVGAGIRLVDDDIKSILGMGALKGR